MEPSPRRLFWNAWRRDGEPNPGAIPFELGDRNPALGRSYTETAAECRSQHKSHSCGSSERRGQLTNDLVLLPDDQARTAKVTVRAAQTPSARGGPPAVTPAIVAAATGEGAKDSFAAAAEGEGTVRLGLPPERRIEPASRPSSLAPGAAEPYEPAVLPHGPAPRATPGGAARNADGRERFRRWPARP